MINPPKTLEEAMKIQYGRWDIDDNREYDPKYCAYQVWGDWYPYQCSRKNGHGINNLYCKQHAKMVGVEEE